MNLDISKLVSALRDARSAKFATVPTYRLFSVCDVCSAIVLAANSSNHAKWHTDLRDTLIGPFVADGAPAESDPIKDFYESLPPDQTESQP